MANLAALRAAVFRYLRKSWGGVDIRPPAVRGLKSVMGPGRAGPGREYSDVALKYERIRSARCARSLVKSWRLQLRKRLTATHIKHIEQLRSWNEPILG